MKYFSAVLAALCRAFVDYLIQSYRSASKPLLLIRLIFVLLTVIVSIATVRAIIHGSDDDVSSNFAIHPKQHTLFC